MNPQQRMEQAETSSDKSWAKLTSLNGVVDLEISVEKFTIGRSKRNNLCLKQNMHVSSDHCYIMRDPEGLAWLCDSSSNGTLINSSVKIHNDIIELHHGDTVHLVLKESDTSKNVAYKFLFKSMLHSEESDADSEGTTEEDKVEASTLPIDIEIVDYDAEAEKEQLSQSACKEDVDEEGPPSKRSRTDIHTGEEDPATKPKPDTSDPDEDKMERNLECSICRDIMHNCVSIQPCLHSFCAHCLLDWRKESRECPTCRESIRTVAKNHLVNNLIEVYLVTHPGKAREPEELANFDRKVEEHKHLLFQSSGGVGGGIFASQPINRGFLSVNLGFISNYPQARVTCRYCRWNAQSIITNLSTSSSESDDSSTTSATAVAAASNFRCAPHQPHVFCQCCHKPMPDRRGEVAAASASVGAVAAAGEGGVNSGAAASPVQACSQCNQLFCHQLWVCDAPGCSGCLAKFRDLQLGTQFPRNLVLQTHETQILEDYLNSQNITFNQMVTDCLDKLASGELTLHPTTAAATVRGWGGARAAAVTADTWLCHRCGLSSLRELAYQYRAAIPAGQLPAQVTAKPDCHYGRQCRTQFTRPIHASRYNHVCAQTRFH